MKAHVLIAAAALGLAACSGESGTAPSRQLVSEIEVETDLSSIGNANAVSYWSRLGLDLQAELARQLVTDISPEGAVLKVDIDEISLANAYSSGFADSASTLSGEVTLTDSRGAELGRYTVTATSNQALSMAPEGTTTVKPGSTEYYAALVRAFSSGVVTTINTPAASGS